ncbi:MAG: Trm112 family protein [Pseudomonadota bacterium]
MIAPELLAVMVCPITRAPLIYDEAAQELISEAAGLAYPIRQGIPVMLIEDARVLTPQTATP